MVVEVPHHLLPDRPCGTEDREAPLWHMSFGVWRIRAEILYAGAARTPLSTLYGWAMIVSTPARVRPGLVTAAARVNGDPNVRPMGRMRWRASGDTPTSL